MLSVEICGNNLPYSCMRYHFDILVQVTVILTCAEEPHKRKAQKVRHYLQALLKFILHRVESKSCGNFEVYFVLHISDLQTTIYVITFYSVKRT